MSPIPYLAVIWMILAAIGGGLILLRMTGLLGVLDRGERLAIAFVIGIGLIGWLVFFPGIAGLYNGASFAVVLAIMTAGLVFVKAPARPGTLRVPLSGLEWLVLAGIVAMLVMDLFEGLSPAADADSMAYHFETPRLFLKEGAIYAIPRALDGVSQLLLQMTYGVALGLGGKPAVPLWTMVSGWGLGALFFVIARRHINRFWALAGTLCLMTTPAVIYSAGAGHVEVRAASFALLAAYAAALSVKHDIPPMQRTGWIVLAGFVAGFFAGTKVTGLIFAFAVCVSVLPGPATIRRVVLFSLATAVTGTQWYLFNWHATGDPLYPMLWKFVDLSPGFNWNEQADAILRMLWAVETPLPKSPLWFVLYPFRSIYFPPSQIEALRTGLGPACVLLLPFAVVAFARARCTPGSLLFRILVAALVFYTVWFVFGPSQRIRHLLVVYPIVMLCILAGAASFADGRTVTRRVMIAGLAAVVVIQLGGQAIFSKKFVDYLTTNETQEEFLSSNIGGYAVINWLNTHLGEGDRVLVGKRDWLYWLDVPYFYSNTFHQSRYPLYPKGAVLPAYLHEIQEKGITHLAIPNRITGVNGTPVPQDFDAELYATDCVRRLAEVQARTISSRTLPLLKTQNDTYIVFKIDPGKCLG